MASLSFLDAVDGASVNSLTTTSQSPTANNGLLLLIRVTNDNDPSSITTSIATFAKKFHFTAGSERMVVYADEDIGASPGSGTVAVNFVTTVGAAGIYLLETNGFHATDMVGVTVDDGAVYNSGGGPYTMSAVLAAFASSSNWTVQYASGDTADTADFTPDSFTELTENDDGTIMQSVGYKTSEDNSPSWNASKDYATVRSVMFELILAAAGGGGSAINVIGPIHRAASMGGTSGLFRSIVDFGRNQDKTFKKHNGILVPGYV